METKVLLYSANGERIGETFARRARQLVKQQRAEWTDEAQSAIRFFEDAEIMEEAKDAGSDDWLFALAEKRIKARNFFIAHSIALCPGSILLLAIIQGLFRYGDEIYFAFCMGSWLTLYAVHLYVFIKSRKGRRRSPSREERHARRLAAEVALLRNELEA